MKNSLLVICFLLVLLNAKSYSQTSCIAADCSKDFTQTFYTVDVIKNYTYYSVAEQMNGFANLGDVYYHQITNTSVTPNKFLDENCNGDPNQCIQDGKAFVYHAYYPRPGDGTLGTFNYATCKPVAIFFFHGGGFSDCGGSLDADEPTIICQGLASKGYVVFNIEYRKGRLVDPATSGKYVTAQQSLAIYRAMQDGRGAIRTILQHNSEAGYYPFKFDDMSIILGGASAGSIIALSIAYTPTPTQIAQIFPLAPGGTITVAQELGPINAPYYYGSTTINIVNRVKCVFNCWGEVLFPISSNNNEADFISGNSNIPALISFHGKADSVNYIGKRYLFYPPTGYQPTYFPVLSHEDNCIKAGRYIVNNDGMVPKTPDVIAEGSFGLYNILKNLAATVNIEVELYADCKMGHGIKSISDDFGIGATSKNDIYKYIIDRAATFFQAVLSGTLSNTNNQNMRDKFVNCENFRVKCDSPAALADNPPNLPPPNGCKDSCSLPN